MKIPYHHRYRIGELKWIEPEGASYGLTDVLLDGEHWVAGISGEYGHRYGVIFTSNDGSGRQHFGCSDLDKDEMRRTVVAAYRVWAMSCLKCGRCGRPENPTHWSDADELIEAVRCRHCAFYDEWVKKAKKNEKMFVAKGHLYTVGSGALMKPHSDGLGFGGRVFSIRFFDNREDVTTNDLWSQGNVPDDFKDDLPDTAEFIPQTKGGS